LDERLSWQHGESGSSRTRGSAAHRSFIVVPLACGFFIDVVNALIISFLVGF
jgi:sodium--glutamate symport carrier gltS